MTTNDNLRRRKANKDNPRPQAAQKRQKSKPASGLKSSLLCLLASATILTVFVLLYVDSIPWHVGHAAFDRAAARLGYERPARHAVVVDAGSTGSRVLAFAFRDSYLGGLALERELFAYTKPGLSSFADAPKGAVDSIAHLLELAKADVPEASWARTPLVLRATAGLRLLPGAQAERLLREVGELVRASPFRTDERAVEVMDGTDEGIFSWFTVNFLLHRFGGADRTVAALDLGGGSTQVTFSALTPASLSQKEFIHTAKGPNGPIPVYTHSYLGLGLMAARQAILTADQKTQNVTSECVNPIIKSHKFHFGGADYYVSGPTADIATVEERGSAYRPGGTVPVVDAARCRRLVAGYVRQRAAPPAELANKQIFAFSYYFDRAADVGLIREPEGGRVLVSDFARAAAASCAEPNEAQPFTCLDLLFISVLLEDGFGLSPNTAINLFKKIDGHEISWALGAAYELIRD